VSDSSEEDEPERHPQNSEAVGQSDPIAHGSNQVGIGEETMVDQLLDKYLILQCAKLHLSVTDASSGSYIPSLPDSQRTSNKRQPLKRKE